MAVTVTGQVGPQGPFRDGSTGQVLRQGRFAEAMVSELNARYQEKAFRGQIFTVANQTAVTTTVGLATTYTGLSLTNPPASPVNLVIYAAGFVITVAPVAITAIGLMGGAGAVTHTTAIAAAAIRPTLIGASTVPQALADGASTIPTPTLLEMFLGGYTAASLPPPVAPWPDLGGKYVVPPGSVIAIYTLTATVGFGFFQWSEEPL